MKVIRHESLGIYIYAKPKNQTEQKYNLNLTARAEAIRCRRFEAIVNERYDFFDKEKMKGDFLAYFKKLADKKNSKWQHVYMHFRTFTQGKCTLPAARATSDLTARQPKRFGARPSRCLSRWSALLLAQTAKSVSM